MKYGLMESFYMHHSDNRYGVACSDRVALFTKAQELGYDGIEFGLTRDYAQDQLWTGEGDLRQAMREASLETGVEARSMCLHLLNYEEFSPASPHAAHRSTARKLLGQALEACHEIGAAVILVPFFGTSTLREPDQIDRLVTEMQHYAGIAESLGISLGLEISLDAAASLEVLVRIASDRVGIYFDVANAVGLGYDVVDEILSLRDRIVQVHIKERPRTPALGSGDIDFVAIAQALHEIGFHDYLVVEQPTSDDAVTRDNLSFLKRMTGNVP